MDEDQEVKFPPGPFQQHDSDDGPVYDEQDDVPCPPQDGMLKHEETEATSSNSSSKSSSGSKSTSYTDEGDQVGDDEHRPESSHSQADLERIHGGSCSNYPVNPDGCAPARSCYDCLNYNVTSEPNGCMVDYKGQCRSAKFYNASMDYSLHMQADDPRFNEYDNVPNEFLAANTTYCSANDPLCQSCKYTVFQDVMNGVSSYSRTRYCTGIRDCVCIAVCESTNAAQKYPEGSENCYSQTYEAQKDHNGNFTGGVAAILGGICLVVGIVFAIYRVRSRESRRRELSIDATAQITTPPHDSSPGSRLSNAGGRLLNLFGWQAMREQLIEREQLRLAGVHDLSPVRNMHVNFTDAQPSAPLADLSVPTAPIGTVRGVVVALRATASAPSAPDFEMDDAPSAPAFEDMDDEFHGDFADTQQTQGLEDVQLLDVEDEGFEIDDDDDLDDSDL